MPRDVYETPFIIRPPDDFTRNQHELRRACQMLALQYASRQAVTQDDLQNIGATLWQALDIDETFRQARESAGAAVLPIVVESSQPEIQWLPWELLYHPELGFLGRHAGFTLSRRLETAPKRRPPLEKGPLRVLLFTSLPEDVQPETGRLNVEEEQARVQEALMHSISQGLVQLEMPDDGRFETLKTLLQDFRPHLLYLSGHGKFHQQSHTGEPDYGVFLFEDENGDGVEVRESELAQALYGSGVQCVVLSACESGKAATDELNHGLVGAISALGVPHVVGMRESLSDAAGIQFVHALCSAIARRERIDCALQAARMAVYEQPLEIPRMHANSREHWCLPLLLSCDAERPLVDWNFTPQPPAYNSLQDSIEGISLPRRFCGRRAELRRYKHDLLQGKIRSLLISGAGGQGKTTLAAKLAKHLQQQDWRVFAWPARPENPWRAFQFELECALLGDNASVYDRMGARFEDEAQRARFLLDKLSQQFQGRMLLLLDNLETLQDADTQELQDETVSAWLRTAWELPGVTLLATSRWQIPGWTGEHLSLHGASYGDFLHMAQYVPLSDSLQAYRLRLRQLYEALGGNARGLKLAASALSVQEGAEGEMQFIAQLEQLKGEMQLDMAVAEIHEHLPEQVQRLLYRLPVYQQAVPEEGVYLLAGELEEPEVLLQRLLAVSLLEVQYEAQWDARQYRVVPLVTDWLGKEGLIDEDQHWLQTAAGYQLYLFKQERHELEQAMVAHDALQRAGEQDAADRLALDDIVWRLNRAGFYRLLIDHWLPDLCESADEAVRGEALGQMGRQYLDIGNYENALVYLQQSLTIRQEIGDRAGEGRTLNNISQIYHAQGDYSSALTYLQQSLLINQQIGDKAGDGRILNNISQIHYAQGDYSNALAYLQQSLVISQQIGDSAGEGRSLGNISKVYHALGNYQTALVYLQQALVIQQEIGDRAGEGTTLNNISALYHAQGEYERALSYLQQTLAIQQEIGDQVSEGSILNNIAQIYDARGMHERALGYLQQALVIQQKIGDRVGEGTTLNNIAQIYDARGEYERALGYLQQSLAIRQEIGDRAGEGRTLNNISQIYHARGDYERALGYLQQSLLVFQEIGDRAGEGTTLNNISLIYDARGMHERALGYLQQSLVIQQEIGDRAGEGTTLNNIAQIFKSRGDYESTLAYLQQSVSIFQQIGDSEKLCTTLFNMGYIHSQKQKYTEALNAWLTVYRMAKPMGLAQALQALAELAPRLGMPPGLAGWEKLSKKYDDG